MKAAAWVLLGWVLSGKSFQGEVQPHINCYEEDGPHPELEQQHRFTPADVFNISIKIVEIQGICKFNITWILNADASITYLKATKICEFYHGCIRCDYLEEFQKQTMSEHQKWQFNFVGFSVEENTNYFIDVYNLPPANINEDHSKIQKHLISPDCEDNSLKYCQNCIEKGSLWDPNITICNREFELEVNFTPSNFCSKYKIHLCDSYECNNSILHAVPTTKGNNIRVSEKIRMNDQERYIIFKELIPYFPGCQNDCKRYSYYQTVCNEERIPEPNSTAFIVNKLDMKKTYVGISITLLLIVCIVVAMLYFKSRHGPASNLAHFHPITAQKPVTILVVYSQEACLQHTVLSFAEFLQEYCKCNVIIDLWQKRRIAEIGTVQWLATQKEIADKVIFLCTTHSSASCDSTCKSIIENQKNSECMFTLALHFFFSDWKMNSSLCKYMVVSFNETHPDPLLPTPLNICPNYFLMKDIDSFCRDLYFSQSQKYKAAKRSRPGNLRLVLDCRD
ncbi:interleukin-17 receptor B isoform X1 [Notechis scutatus]|uniref:Interleukin-17 receptor B isoform X1 n=1 Tax=Notechis scutatus TaxID=8663 RepID=A0A6J1UNI0_9SAUR|nr:interleukin-17 receptor B isoform X1 [Notechis scutatus]